MRAATEIAQSFILRVDILRAGILRASTLRIGIVFALTFLLFASSGVLFLAPSVAEASSVGFPLFSWGHNSSEQLGRAVNTANPANRPARVVDHDGVARDRWVASSSAIGGSWAISTSGHLYAWGAVWSVDQMGQGGVRPPAAFLSGNNIARPMRVGAADNWVELSSVGNFVVLLNSDGEIFRLGNGVPGSIFTGTNASNIPVRVPGPSSFVQISGGQGQVFGLTDNGEIWTAGDNSFGLFANGTTTGSSMSLRKIENTEDNWVAVSGGRGVSTMQGAAFAINTRGELFAWGSNNHGQTGRGITTGITTVPTRIGAANNWVDVRLLSVAVVALNSNGEIFSWGSNVDGRTGLGTTTGDTTVPTRVGTASNWVSIAGGFTHVLAFNAANELWGWGRNNEGQLGLGHNLVPRATPQFIIQTYGFADAARGGSTHSMMLIRTDPVEEEFLLEKVLQMPEDTPMPNLSFTFTFEKNSYNDDPANAHLLPDIPDRIVHINSATDTTSDGHIRIAMADVDILEGVSFGRSGVHSYLVREVRNSSATLPPSHVDYSLAVYEMRIYVEGVPANPGTLYVSAVTITPLVVDNDAQTEGEKTESLIFTNTYTRTTAGTIEHPGALSISKSVEGNFANLSTPFEFEVILSAHELCSRGEELLVGRVVDVDNEPVGDPISFPNGVAVKVALTDGQRLIFDELTIGTGFEVMEQATAEFVASVELFVNGEPVAIEPNQYPDTALSVGSHVIGSGRNTADFTNNHLYLAPTGLRLRGTPISLIVVALAISALLLVSKTSLFYREIHPSVQASAEIYKRRM